MNGILSDFSASALTTAIKTNLFDWYRYWGRSPNIDCKTGRHLTWSLTGIPFAFLNAVFDTQLPSEGGDKIIADTLAYFRSRSVTHLSWYVEPGTEMLELGRLLSSHSLTYDEGMPGMAVDLALSEQPTPPGSKIVPVKNREMLQVWGHTLWLGYQMSIPGEDICFELFASLGFELPLQSYIAYLDGQPVATSQLFLSAGVAGIYCVAVLPEARRQGIGAAITLAPLLDARTLGYRIGILQSSPMGYPVYRRLGFQEYCKLNRYVWKV